MQFEQMHLFNCFANFLDPGQLDMHHIQPMYVPKMTFYSFLIGLSLFGTP